MSEEVAADAAPADPAASRNEDMQLAKDDSTSADSGIPIGEGSQQQVEDEMPEVSVKPSDSTSSTQQSQISSKSKSSSQESRSNSCSTSASQNSESGSTSSGSTLKRSQSVCNEDENSSSSTIRNSQPGSIHSDDDNEEHSRSTFKSNRSSPDKSQSQSKCSQSTRPDLTEDSDTRSSISSSKTASQKQSQKSIAEHSDDSRSSFQSSNKSTSQKSSEKLVAEQSDEESNSRSSFQSSNKSTSQKPSQKSVADQSDEESNSRSSFQSSNKSASQKPSQNESPIKENQSDNFKLVMDEDSSSSLESFNTKITSKKSQPLNNISDDENSIKSSVNSPVKKNSPDKNVKPKKYFSIVDSESEDEIVVYKNSVNNKRDSDSDSTVTKITPIKKSKKSKLKNIKKLIDSDSDEDKSDNESGKENIKSKNLQKSNKISHIIDSDSDSNHSNCSEQENNISSGEENKEKSKTGKNKPEKKRKGSARASKNAAMQQIHSETQRLIRESNVSLPYHRPKQRTLQEFLNRKKILSNIPQNMTCAARIKMFPEVVSKVVEEKEKEAELFYKSSDSEEEENEAMETDQSNVESNKIETKSIDTNENSSSCNISDTQKLTQDNIQVSQNKISILQQRSLDLGVPKKLFLDDENNSENTNDIQMSSECLNEKESDNVKVLDQKDNEVKTGLQDECVLQKAISDDTEAMEVCDETQVDNISKLEKIDLKNSKVIENSKNDTKQFENETERDSSTEEFVLQMTETEPNTCENDDSVKTNKNTEEQIIEKENQEKMITETPVVNTELSETKNSSVEDNSRKDESLILEKPKNLDDLNVKSTEESDELILELPKETDKDDEIIDKNALKDDIYAPPDLDEPVTKLSIKKKILAETLKIKPMIKGSPGSVIDFTSSDRLREGVTKLMDRFTRHSAFKRPVVNNITEVKVFRTEGSGNDVTVIEEVLPFNKSVVEDDSQKESKPGEKLKKLKEDLKRKIVSARTKEWKVKEENEKEDEEDEDENEKDEDFYAGLPEDEDLLEDEESAESEPEEDDVPMVDKKRSNCEFGDDEAEESLEEGEENEDDMEEDDENDGEEEGEDEENDEDDEDEKSESEEEDKEADKGPKKLKRIIKPFDDDSNDSDISQKNDIEAKLSLERTKTDEDMFPSQIKSNFVLEEMESESIPPFIRERLGSDARNQACKTPLPKPYMVLSMVSPVNHLTILNTSLDSARKSEAKTPKFDLGGISTENTPLENSARPPNSCSLEKMMNLQKKLFDDPPEAVDDRELLEVCSGKFTDSQDENIVPCDKPANVNEVTDSQLMDICSGSFLTQTIDMKKLENTLLVGDETSQDITLTLDDDENPKNSPMKASSSLKPSDESLFSSDSKSPVKSVTPKSPVKFKSPMKSTFKCKNPMEAWLKKANQKTTTQTQPKQINEVTDSQLLDVCSGAFTSQPIDMKELEKEASEIQHPQNSQNLLEENSMSPFRKVLENEKKSKLKEKDIEKEDEEEEESMAPWSGFTIASSSDEENKGSKNQKVQRKKKVLKKKKVQKLDLSDDEEEENNEFSDLDESEVEEYEDEEEKYVEYDSDENEIVVVPKKEIKKVATKFLENEAELSESEWGSDDEDEEDLDKLEYEEGDAEDIDEAKMKDQLDKIHMKQVMDEDQREVRLLQELLFDDGDLHSEGAGRERKFRWKNIDGLGEDDNTETKPDDNADDVDDEIDTTMEVEMRKMRYEQQKFLEEKQKTMGKLIDDDFNESEIFKLGLKVVSLRSSSKTIEEESKIAKSNSDSSNLNGPLKVVTKKVISNTKSLSFTNMRGSFLARGEETLIRIAQNLPTTTKVPINPGRKRKFVFEHLSPTVNNNAQEDLEHENNATPTDDSKKRKRKIFSSQTPTSTKKIRTEDRKSGKRLF